MKKLFLTSSFKDAANILKDFETDLYGKTVTFIPTASNVEKVVFFVNSGKKALKKLGLTIDELDISVASSSEIATTIRKNDFIYISGGNTFFLLQELKRTGADQVIIQEVHSGKLYIGESAGAMITSPDIEYAQGMDSVKKAPSLVGFNALGIVDFYTVPHHTNAPFKKIVERIITDYSSVLNLVPISNKSAILVEGSDIRVENN